MFPTFVSSQVRKALKAVELIAASARKSVQDRLDQKKLEDSSCCSSSLGKNESRNDLLSQLLNVMRENGGKVDFGHGDVVTEVWGGL